MTFDPWNSPAPPSSRDTGPAAAWRDWWLAREVEPLARAQGFVLDPQQLAGVGITRSAARHGIRLGRFTAAARGQVGVVDVRDSDAFLQTRRRHALAAAAAVRLRPDHVVSGRSAAILHGLPTLIVPACPELTARRPSGNGRRNSTHVYPAALADAEVGQWFGAPVTSIPRTLVDLARHNRRDGIMAADAALFQEMATAGELEGAVARARGWPGVRQARAVLALASPLAESPLESVTRLALFDDGFPEPEMQYRIGTRRVDLALVDQRLVIEADGRVKYRVVDGDDSDPLWQEKLREHEVHRPGWVMERVVWSDVTRGWPTTSDRLWRAMLRLGPLPPATPWRLLWPLAERDLRPQRARRR